MEETKSFSAKFSQEELLVVLLKYRLPLILGMDQKLVNFPRDVLEIVLKAAERALIARDIITPGKDGKPHIDPVALMMISTCASPERTIICTCVRPDQKLDTHLVYRTKGSIVAHDAYSEGVHVLTALPDLKTAQEWIVSQINLRHLSQLQCDGGEISQTDFSELREMALQNRTGQIESRLDGLVDEQTADLLSQTLEHVISLTAIVSIKNSPEESHDDGFSLLEGINGLWLLTSAENQTIMKVKPAGFDDFMQELKRLMEI